MPLQITYRAIQHSDAIDAHIRERAEKLSHGGAPLPSCRVVIDAPHRHKLHGRHYVVRIAASTAQGDIIVDRSPDAARQQESLLAAIDTAFDHAMRQLHEHAHKSESVALRKGRSTS